MILFPLLLGWVSASAAQGREAVPFQFIVSETETLASVAERFQVDLDRVEELNPTLWSRPQRILLIDRPRNADEAVLLLEEAKRVEVLGGVGARKAKRLYRGILEAARLIPSEEGPSEMVEMSSETVAQALLSWGEIHETQDPNQSQWAYIQVRNYFPDKKDYLSLANIRLGRLESAANPDAIQSSSSGLEWYPVTPHILFEIDAKKLGQQLRDLDLPRTFASLDQHPNERVRKRHRRGVEKFEETLLILSHMTRIHIGGWLDSETYAQDPEEGLRASNWVVVGELNSPFADFSSALELPDKEGSQGGFDLFPLGDTTYLATDGAHVLVARREILDSVIEGKPPFEHPSLSSPDSAYQQARVRTGSGATLFGYLDLEGFLKGPALEFARNGDPRDEEAVLISLLLSGLIGANSIQGFAFSLVYDRDTLLLRSSLHHQGEGLLTLFTGDPCPSRTLPFFPEDTHGFLQIRRPCTPAVENFLSCFDDRFLGLAGPIYRAHYQRILDQIEMDEEVRIDPLSLLSSGILSEISVGLQVPGGMVPLPNLLVAAPTTLASPELIHLEKLLTQSGEVEFTEEKRNGHLHRHALIPIESPLFLDLTYTIEAGTLLVSNNPDMLEQAIGNRAALARLEENPDFLEFREEWFPSSHVSLFLSETLATRLARLAKALVSAKTDQPDLETFATIFQSEMDRIADDPHYSGFGIRLGEKGIEGNLQIRSFRSYLSALLSLRWMKKVDNWRSEN